MTKAPWIDAMYHLEEYVKKKVDRAVQEEREACAQIADQWATDGQREFGNGGPAAAIRARGKK